tara:strand:+ start:1588 stop:2097 length:510 start_codon:yes stop_codon:yes gene_type:complete
MTEDVQVKKSLPAAVAQKDLAAYWLNSAVSIERMLQSVMEGEMDPSDLMTAMRGVEVYARVRTKIGEMVQKAVDVSGEDSWDPFAPDPFDRQVDVAVAKTEFSTAVMNLPTADKLTHPQQAALQLYQAGATYREITDKTELSKTAIDKLLRKTKTPRRKRKNQKTVDVL